MKSIQIRSLFAVVFASFAVVSCGNNNSSTTSADTTRKKTVETMTTKIKEVAVSYKADTVTSNGYITYDEGVEGKRPVVLIVPEWWGLGDYVRSRANQLAAMGYVAMCVDMYGNGKTAEDPKSAGELAMPFYKNPLLTKIKIDAALAKLKDFPQADMTKVAAIGYCFGGYSVLNAAKLGADLKGVVSFHGNLTGVLPSKELLKSKILVCHGAADKFVPEAEVNAFKKSMDSVGADYTFKTYADATHAFTNPGATDKGQKYNMPIRYNGAADTASWNDMKVFFGKIF